jgi:hypothetical protein
MDVEMSSQNFKLKKHSVIDKQLTIQGNDLTIWVDYDDVDTTDVLRKTKKLVQVLENYWDEEEE